MIEFLTTGSVLGLSASIAPGPLLALVISETLQHGSKAGIKVALSPVITDAPIIVLALLLSASLDEFHTILGVISFAGGSFLLYLGINSLRSRGVTISLTAIQAKSLRKGLLVNAMSPHPYLFWITIGAPIMTKALAQNTYCVIVFILSFYTLLVGSKIILAVITGKSRTFMTGNAYILIMRMLGVILCIFAGLLFSDSLRFLGIW